MASRSSRYFDGVDDYMDGGASNRNITNQVTLEAWVKTSSAATQWVAGKHSLATNAGFYLYLQNGRAAFAGSNSAGNAVGSGFSLTSVNDNDWHHLAGVYDNGTWQIWVDGLLESSSIVPNPSIIISTAAFTVAKSSNTNSLYFTGRIAEVKMWSTARTEQEIRTFMCQIVKNASPELAAYYKMDSFNAPAPKDMVKDDSGFGLNGSLFNYNTTFNQVGPPVGDESIFYYGPDKEKNIMKLAGYAADTVQLNYISGNSKGIHFYRSNTPPIVDEKAKFVGMFWFYGVYTFGDPSAKYQVTHSLDTTKCNNDVYLHKRFDATTPFRKITPGRFSLVDDKISQIIDQYRGEYTFMMLDAVKLYFNGTLNLCPKA